MRNKSIRLVRITTVPVSLNLLLAGQLEYFQDKGYFVFAISSGDPEKVQQMLKRIPFYNVPFTRKITPIQDLYCLIKLIYLIWKIKPDIVHTHTPKAGLLGMIASYLCRVPCRLHTVAGIPWINFKGNKRRLFIFLERLTYLCAHKVYPNSYGLLEFISHQFPTLRKKFKIIGKGSSNGIAVDYFSVNQHLLEEAVSIKRKLGIGNDTISIGFVGRLTTDKGISELLNSFQNLLEEGIKVKLILVGNFDNERDKLSNEHMSFIKENPSIYHAGFQMDVRPWLLAMDIFVFPSYREGFPNALLQAACMERPCIASAIIGNTDIIMHEYSGLLVQVRNVKSLFLALKRLINKPHERFLFGQRARQYVVKNFEQHYFWEKIHDEYKELQN